jgi:hypothetical protein
MTIGNTLFNSRWPTTTDFSAIANVWQKDATNNLLTFIWNAYDLLKNDVLDQTDDCKNEEELERCITQLLEARIQRVMTGDEPFYVQHGPYEYETRKDAPAQPPQYDIAFALNNNPRIMWPCEAKVLHTDGTVAEYVNDINDEFLTCRYAPFSSGGAMLGYLFSGSPNKVFANIEKKVPCKLFVPSHKSERAQRYSNHKRNVITGKPYPINFRCHHLILQIAKKRDCGIPSPEKGEV